MTHLERWGERPCYMPDANDVVRWIIENIGNDSGVFARFQPAPSAEKPEMLAIWPDRKSYDTGSSKRLRGKAGKMLKRMFPEISPAIIERFSNWYSEKYAAKIYTLNVATDSDSFALAYEGDQAEYKNPATTGARKSMSTSCMRHQFMHDHPATAYASGDFEIIYLTDENDRIAGRCVLRIEPCVAGPVYGVSESAIDQIEAYLDARGAALFSYSSNWIGARLQRIESDCGGFIAPYLDPEPRRLRDNGSYLVIDDSGKIDASDYDGILNAGQRCDCCDCGISDDESYSLDWIHETYCEHCYHERFTYCDNCSETVENSSIAEYLTIDRLGRESTEYCCESCRDDIATETASGDWMETSHILTTESGDIITPAEYEDSYFTSDWDFEIYPCEDMARLADGDRVAKSELPDSYEEIDGIWVDTQLKLELSA